MGERQPIKYKDLMGKRRQFLPVADPDFKLSMERVVNGDPHSDEDRQAIAKGSYYTHWNIETKGSTAVASSKDPLRPMDQLSYYRRYATLYKGFIRRIFGGLQARLDQSEEGKVTIAWQDVDGNEQTTEIDQHFVDTLSIMAGRMREALYDAGYQSVVNTVHQDLGILHSVDRNMQMQINLNRTSTFNGQEGGEDKWLIQ